MKKDPTRYWETIIILRNWTDDEICTLNQINKNWHIQGQTIKRGNDDV